MRDSGELQAGVQDKPMFETMTNTRSGFLAPLPTGILSYCLREGKEEEIADVKGNKRSDRAWLGV